MLAAVIFPALTLIVIATTQTPMIETADREIRVGSAQSSPDLRSVEKQYNESRFSKKIQ